MQSALHLAIDTKAFSNINSCVTIRRVELKDLEALEQLSAEEGWDIGVHNLLLYYQTCPEGWFLAETADGTIVAYDSYNCLPNGLRCGFQLVFRSDYRGRGLTRLFNTMDYANFPGFGNSTSNSLQRYSSLSTITWKLIAFEGLLYSCRIPSTPFTSETVVKLSPDSFLDLCNYDREIVLTDRMNFLRDFALPNNSTLAKCLLALDQNKTVKGYGVLRLCSDYYTIAPVYADNNDIAMALLTGLCRLVPEGSRLHIPFHAECNSTLGLCHQLCFIQCTSEVRTYRSDAFAALGRQLDLNRVYAIQEYWPL